ncbi:2OG-Fe(II) oxygenase [Bradyrhizobium ottawaense]|uniref:Prolyl 4-hydroxylase alpha subunit Fe(2+) 2OG dioxygenase domain-containing protein n=1 Tax=Bradyrhizobium ottawaense TaxID=931866 RepID=A0ABV4FZ48_9BRAD
MHVDFQLHSLSGLLARASSLRAEYAAARPWPHVVLNDAFPEKLLDMVAAECAALPEARLITTTTDRLVKQEVSDGLGPATQHLLSLVDSAGFRAFISAVTGVRDLHSDPTHKFAGVHRTPPGGFTKIHRDFEVHPTTGLFHRVNLLIYLNRDWPEAYGGSLELWPADMSALGCRIFPRFNTVILWETHGATLHGLPDPVSCPPGRMRAFPSHPITTRRRAVSSHRANAACGIGQRDPAKIRGSSK